MTISEIIKLPTGTKVNNINVVVKRPRKTHTLGDETTQELVVQDSTGEIAADVLLASGQYGPERLYKYDELLVLVGEIQNAEEGLKLYICRYQRKTMTVDEWEASQDPALKAWQKNHDKEIEGKCRYGVVCSMIQAGRKIDTFDVGVKCDIERLVEYIQKGLK